MPIEIREVIIKAEVRDAREESPVPAAVDISAENRENLIRECAAQVLRILEDKKAR